MKPLILAAAMLLPEQHYAVPPLKDAIFICAAIDGEGKIFSFGILQVNTDMSKRDKLLQMAHDPSLRVDAPPNRDPDHPFSGNKYQTPVKITERGAEPITGRICHLQPVP